MKTFRFISVNFILVTVFAVSVFAQAQPPAKIAVINTQAFYDEKVGITKIINAYKVLETEFKTTTTELDNGLKRFQTLQVEIKALQDRANDPTNKVPIDPKAAQAKVDEAEKLQRDLKFKDEEFKAQLTKRQGAILGPINQDIGKVLTDFATQKGYAVILDASKLDQAGVLLALDKTADVTEEFIKFYNARPAGSALTTPK